MINLNDICAKFFQHGFKFSITRPWKGEEKMKKPDTFNNPGTADAPIDTIIDFSKTDRRKP